MIHLSIDLETYSDVNLKKAGLYRYVQSPAFEILLFAYSLDGAPTQVIDMAQGEKIPLEVIHALTDPQCLKHAYNAAFEWYCLSKYMGVQLPPSQWRDTMLHGLYAGYTAGLDATGRALGIPENMFTVMFALARLPGWIAHWKEMIGANTKIVRPRQVYIGKRLGEE